MKCREYTNSLNLRGTIPDVFDFFPNLRILYLIFLITCFNLETRELSSVNAISGTFPESIGHLSSLELLYVMFLTKILLRFITG